jgi:hypothetical protein
MDTSQILLVLGIAFVGCNIFSLLLIAWLYGRRVLQTLRMPAMLQEPLVYHHAINTEDEVLEGAVTTIALEEVSI